MKDMEVAAVDDAEVSDEMETEKKRHLNVVFIGHVGRYSCLMVLLMWKLACTTHIRPLWNGYAKPRETVKICTF